MLDLGVDHVCKNGLLRFVNSFRVPWLPLKLVMPRAQPCRTQETCVQDSLGGHLTSFSILSTQPMLPQAHIGFLAWAHFFFVPWATVLETPIYGRQGDYTEGEIKTLILYDFYLCTHLLGHPGKQHPWVWLPPPCPLQSCPGQFPNYLKAEESAVWV